MLAHIVDDLDKVSERFDAVYTEMTRIQRALIAARRDGYEPSLRDLLDRARVITRAVEIGVRAVDLNGPSYAEMESAALAAKVLQPPVDDHLLLAALRSQRRAEGFPMLSAALRMSAADIPIGLGSRKLVELVGAPKAVGPRMAEELCAHWGLSAAPRLADLTGAQLSALCDQLEDAAVALPTPVRKSRGQKPAARADGVGEANTLLDVWIKASGEPANGVREHVLRAARTLDWGPDAIPAALRIGRFTQDHIIRLLIGDVNNIAVGQGVADQVEALQVQAHAWFRSDDERTQEAGAIVLMFAESLDATAKLRAMEGDYSRRVGGKTAMAHARHLARRSGELLECCEPDAVADALSHL
jgi:hypothetical protein